MESLSDSRELSIDDMLTDQKLTSVYTRVLNKSFVSKSRQQKEHDSINNTTCMLFMQDIVFKHSKSLGEKHKHGPQIK